MKKLLFAFVFFLMPLHAAAQGMATSADPRATEAGRDILRAGGSAADAAMAMMLALTVVEPQSSGIGGGGFLLHYDAKTSAIATIDGREVAPVSATPRRFLDQAGQPLPYAAAYPGGSSVGVPGNIRLMALTHEKWGRLPWARLFDPAIRLAEQGFQVTPPLAKASAAGIGGWARFPIAALYAPGGQPLAVGATVTNPALAATLRRIAAGGADAFYTGETAAAVVKAATLTNIRPSDMGLGDMNAYRARDRDPVCRHYRRRWIVCAMGPPSSGATTVLGILGMVERFDLTRMGASSPTAWHLIGEAMQLAYADRDTYLADPDFVAVPVAGLLDRRYLASRSALISPTRTLGSYPPGTPPGMAPRTPALQAEVPSTTHFIAIDRDGDVATMTSTVEGPFGSQLVAGGFVLNNELTDFTFAPERDSAPVANAVAPGKRPLSSMSPVIVFDAKSGRPIFTVGAAGGKTIIMQVAKALIAHLDWGMPAREAIGLGLIYFDRDGLVLEEGTGTANLKAPLEALGHHVAIDKLALKANAAEWREGRWIGAADPRSVGTALAE